MDKRIGIIASRLKCIDAVSIDSENWIDCFKRLGYETHLISGKFGEPTNGRVFELPEIDYKHPEVRGIKRILFSATLNKEGIRAADILMNNLVRRIKGPLKNYIQTNKIKIICVQDALISYKHLPLNIALQQIISELGLFTISKYHYIPWDNPYYTTHNNIPQTLKRVPPVFKNILHITNTNSTKLKLKERKISPRVIPNLINLEKLHSLDDYNKNFRSDLDIPKDALIFLQPTRVKKNKNIEESIRIISEFNYKTNKDCVLLLTGSPVYSRGNYFEEIIKKAKKLNVDIVFGNDHIFLDRHENSKKKFYSIHDAYVNADVVLYPNTGDAFGNPIIEAAAYKKPIITCDFPNLSTFKDAGMNFIIIDSKVIKENVSDLYEIIYDEDKKNEIVNKNFKIVRNNFSSDTLDGTLIPILNSFHNQPSFFSRVAKTIIPSSIIPSSLMSNRPNNGKNDNTNQNKNTANKPYNSFQKTKIKLTISTKKNKKTDLKNKKGGYKEP